VNLEQNSEHSIDFCMLDYKCSYLPEQQTRMYYRYMRQASKELVTALIKRGWRRFGCYFFHPICAKCNECKSLRIDAENFKLSRSQKRVIKKNSDTYIYIRKPGMTQEHLDLYDRYHKYKSEISDWKYTPINSQHYYENFVDGSHNYGKEVLYFIDDKLVGVDLIDIVDDGISSIYFYYDPEYSKYSLGTYSLLMQIEIAKRLRLKWIYLGYWVDGCKSFAYKMNFKPMQILDGFPALSQEPEWREI
jgi:arginine-tRNA-protein transferase